MMEVVLYYNLFYLRHMFQRQLRFTEDFIRFSLKIVLHA